MSLAHCCGAGLTRAGTLALVGVLFLATLVVVAVPVLDTRAWVLVLLLLDALTVSVGVCGMLLFLAVD